MQIGDPDDSHFGLAKSKKFTLISTIQQYIRSRGDSFLSDEGFVISVKEIHPTKEKVQAIDDLPKPSSVKQLCGKSY